MFKKSLKFGMAFPVLAVGAFIAILAACGDSSSSDDNGSSSNSNPVVNVPDKPIEGIETVLNVKGLSGKCDALLEIEGSAKATKEDIELDYVEVMFDDDKTIIVDRTAGKVTGKNWTIPYPHNMYEFKGMEFCGEKRNVRMRVYPKTGAEAIYNEKTGFTRDCSACASSSSDGSSASGATVTTFELAKTMTLYGTGSGSNNRGIILSSGTATDDLNSADIYYDGDKGVVTTKKTNVKMVRDFKYENHYEPVGWINASSHQPPIGINPPSNVSDFFPWYIGLENENLLSEISDMNIAPFYAMVRTNYSSSVGTAWRNVDYLVAFTSSNSINKTIDIKVWKAK